MNLKVWMILCCSFIRVVESSLTEKRCEYHCLYSGPEKVGLKSAYLHQEHALDVERSMSISGREQGHS